MTETTLSPEDAAAQRASEQARLRKERREAKLKAGGSARLSKITGLAGGIPRDAVEPVPVAPTTDAAAAASAPSPPAPSAAAPAKTTAAPHGDPDEVDISQHFYEPKTTQRVPAASASPAPEPSLSEDQLRQLMLGFDAPGQAPGGGPPAGADEDPLMKMMTQMMGGAGGAPGSSPFPGMPNLASFAAAPQQQQQQPIPSDPYTALWRLLHALVALGLGLYIAVLTPFSGTKVERERAALLHATDGPAADWDDDLERRKSLFFWTFATAETLLLTTRFYLDKGREPTSGIVSTVVGFLPQPYKGYVEIGLRYARIFTTVRADMLACVFVLGVCAWWRG